MTVSNLSPCTLQSQLPDPRTEDGQMRHIGVEVEFGGVSEEEAAKIVQSCLGGRIEQEGLRKWRVSGTLIGDLEFELDAFFKDAQGPVVSIGIDMARSVVPVEMVTKPITEAQFTQLQDACVALRAAGATGSRHGVFLGYGVHFNVEVRSNAARDVVPQWRAYALIEDWLRSEFPIDTMRHLMPFVDRYPSGVVKAAASEEVADWTLEQFTAVYLNHVRSRNHGLDLLPLLGFFRPADLEARGMSDAVKSVRPAFHFRLPDCRIDESDWGIAQAWQMWIWVEKVAANPALLSEIAGHWRERHHRLLPSRQDWADDVRDVLRDAGLLT